MPSGKRHWTSFQKDSSSSSRRPTARKQTSATDDTSSSPGFQTPTTVTNFDINRIARRSFAKSSSSAPQGSSWPETPSPGLVASKSVLLPPPRSHTSRDSTPRVLVDENGDRDELETADEIERREEDDALNETIMAIDMRDKGTLGCAYYIAREEKLYMMEDVKFAGFDVVDTLKLHAQPTTILISTRADEAFMDYLAQEARANDRENDDNNIFGSYVLNSRLHSEFSFQGAKNKLTNLDLFTENGSKILFITPGEDSLGDGLYEDDGGMGHKAKLIRLSSWVDLESKLTVGCAGAVLGDIQRRKNTAFLPGDAAACAVLRIRTIEMFSLSDTMFMNVDTIASLQIFQSESHPNSHMQGPSESKSGAKESLSVFGIFSPFAHTPQGKQKLRQMFLRPSLNLALIRERNLIISTFLRPENATSLEKVVKGLKRVKDIRPVVINLQKGQSGGSRNKMAMHRGVWGSLREFTYQVLRIIEALCGLQDNCMLPIVIRLLRYLEPSEGQATQLRAIGEMITQTVDFVRSAEQHRTAVMQGVDAELDQLKQKYDGMEDLLTKVARVVASEVPEWARHYVENCIFFPQLGFLTVVPLDPESGKGSYEGEGMEGDLWERRFSTDSMAYYKNSRMVELDNGFGDMYSLICDREIEIIQDLAIEILQHEEMLIRASELCGDLDSVIALALGARNHSLNSPRLTTSNVIKIVGGKHLLQELTVPSYVTNDTFLVGGPGSEENLDETVTTLSNHGDPEGPSMLMMTGPNYSGKSVYLKQVALIVYLAHIGSFVPAESATIGVTDKILTRIATRESISSNQSAFMIDLQQAALAMSLATRRSLVLIDEFGKGTNSTDGAGLACGVFEHFLSGGPERPKVLGATHFHEIFENGYLEDRRELSFGHMEVRIDTEAAAAEDQVTYLYNFVPERSMASFGTSCAAMNGINSTVIERAEELILLSARGEDLVAACTILSENEMKDLEDAEQVARRFLAQDITCPEHQQNQPIDVRGMLDSLLALGGGSST